MPGLIDLRSHAASPSRLDSAPPPLAAVTRETGRDLLPTRSWFHGSREESSFGAVGWGSGPGHQLDALFGEPGVTFKELSRCGSPGMPALVVACPSRVSPGPGAPGLLAREGGQGPLSRTCHAVAVPRGLGGPRPLETPVADVSSPGLGGGAGSPPNGGNSSKGI